MAENRMFVIKGEIRRRKDKITFSKEMEAVSKIHAEDKIKSLFGSNYRLKRNQISISSVEEVK